MCHRSLHSCWQTNHKALQGLDPVFPPLPNLVLWLGKFDKLVAGRR
jgi:hypothetical protein